MIMLASLLGSEACHPGESTAETSILWLSPQRPRQIGKIALDITERRLLVEGEVIALAQKKFSFLTSLQNNLRRLLVNKNY